jgi:hypothetical protein
VVGRGELPKDTEKELPGRGIIAPDGIFHSDVGTGRVEQYDWKDSVMLIHGKVTYDDMFGVGHWTKFCYAFIPGVGSTPCDTGNDIDPN